MRSLFVFLILGLGLSLYVGAVIDGKSTLELGSVSTNIVLALIQIGGLVLIYFQLRHQKQLSVAQFTSSIMEQLSSQREFHRKLEGHLQNPSDELNIDNAEIVAFLNVFENLASLLESGVIKIDNIDQPFAYRFFLAVNNTRVQDLELIRDGDYYRSIYRLHKKWKAFRELKHLPQIGEEENSLESRCKKYEVLAKKDKPNFRFRSDFAMFN